MRPTDPTNAVAVSRPTPGNLEQPLHGVVFLRDRGELAFDAGDTHLQGSHVVVQTGDGQRELCWESLR